MMCKKDYVMFIWDLDRHKTTTQTESLSSQKEYDSQTVNRRTTETQPG